MELLPSRTTLSRSDLLVLMCRHFGPRGRLPVRDERHVLDLPAKVSFSLGKVSLRDGSTAFSARASDPDSGDHLHVLYRVREGCVQLVVIEKTMPTQQLTREIAATIKFVKGKGPRPSCSLLSALAALPLMGLCPRASK